jgi:hypothetical protein
MADISTVLASVATTLGVQGAYYIFMSFPDKHYRIKTEAEKIAIQNSTEYRLYEQMWVDVEATLEIFHEWKMHLVSVHPDRDNSVDDRDYFLHVLPRIAITLGRLKGSSSSRDPVVNDLLLSHIGLLEKAQYLTKSLVSGGIITSDTFALDLLDLKMIYSQVEAKVKQVRIEYALSKSTFKRDIESLNADSRDLTRRLNAASTSVLILTVVASIWIARPFVEHLPGNGTLHFLDFIVIVCCCLVIVAISFKLTITRSLKNTEHLTEGLERPLESMHAPS